MNRLPLTDGRWEVYELALLQAVRRAPADPRMWQQVASRFHIRGVLLQHASSEARALLPRFSRDPSWRLVYWDYAASFWMRSDQPNLPPAAPLVPPAPPERLDDCLMLDLFLNDIGATALRIVNLQRALAFRWRTDVLLERLGQAQLAAQQWADAEKTFESLLELRPRSTAAMNELAFLSFRRGDLAKAERWLRTALEIQPDNSELRANLARVQNAQRDGQRRP